MRKMSKFYLITGASSDIGISIARCLAKEGYYLYLHYNSNEEAMRNLLTELEQYNGEYIPIQADLSVKAGVEKLATETFALSGIIHCTGMTKYDLLLDNSYEDISRQLFINLESPIYLTKLLLPKLMNEEYGRIIFISSIWGQTGASCETVYSAAKGGQIAFAKALSKEVAFNQITVNAIAPGTVETKMINHLSKEEEEELKNEIPLNRFAQPSEIAHSVKFLLSKEASYITGQVIAINGGWYM